MRANARNNPTYVKREPWYAYERLWNSVQFAGRRRAVQLNFPGTERQIRIGHDWIHVVEKCLEGFLEMSGRANDLVVPSSFRLPFRRHDDPSRISGRSCLWRDVEHGH